MFMHFSDDSGKHVGYITLKLTVSFLIKKVQHVGKR
jgi:hypothetical protein